MQAQELLDLGADVVICSSTEDITKKAKEVTGEHFKRLLLTCFCCYKPCGSLQQLVEGFDTPTLPVF